MCGIFGYVGTTKKPSSLLLSGLKSLEYRGYDSWGIVVISGGNLKRERHVGKIGEARTVLPETTTGMGHTRWATHGGVTVANAHPHLDCMKKFAVIHNGIIENERELRQALKKRGHTFSSQTDTETIAHLLEEISKKNDLNLVDQVRLVTSKLEGAFAIGVIDRDRPEEIVLARFGGPLVVGITDGYKLFASDPTALLPFTKQVVYLQDRELAWITPDNVEIRSFSNHKKNSTIHTLDWDVEKTKKGGFRHFMLKEIMEQPFSLTNTIRGRIKKDGTVKLGGLESVKQLLCQTKFIRMIASGSASYTGIFGSLAMQDLTDITVFPEAAAEFTYLNVNWPANSAAWFISQSGETADVLNSLKKVKSDRIPAFGLVNVVGSSIARLTNAGVYLHAGPEMAVASTKAFTSQLTSLLMIACWLSQLQEDTSPQKQKLAIKVTKEILKLPKLVGETLKLRPQIRKLSKHLLHKRMISYFGRGFCYPIALEGSIKLKEISYLDVIALPTGDLKHGPIAAMDSQRPAIVLAPYNRTIEKNRSSIQELKARGVPVFVITDRKGKEKLSDVADEIIVIPDANEFIQPILLTVVVQLIAYETAVLLKLPIDKPRNLAKSVTVE